MSPEAASVDEPPRSAAAARFHTLYERHYPAIWAFGRRRVAPAQVDDVVAETFLTAWRRIDDVPDGERALLWLYRVAYRVVGHQWRTRDRQRRLRERIAAVPDQPMAAADDAVLLDDDVRRVLAAADRLNRTDAEVVRLLCWEQLSRDEIAHVLDLEPNAAGQRIHRARKNLAKAYERLERHEPDRIAVDRRGGAR